MTLYLLQMCDRAGHVLHVDPVEASDVYGALAQANGRLRSMIDTRDESRIDRRGRIDVTDPSGCQVARVLCREAIAAMS